MTKKNKLPEPILAEGDPVPVHAPGWVLGIGVALLVVAIFAGITAVIRQRPSEPLRLPAEAMTPAASIKPTPAPWTYDSVTNQHWDPTHKHWHAGHPPNQGHAGEAARTAPDIPNPTAWQYDAASNQHFNPDHNHWHGGLPPADKVEAVPAVEVAPIPASSVPVPLEQAVEVPIEPVP